MKFNVLQWSSLLTIIIYFSINFTTNQLSKSDISNPLNQNSMNTFISIFEIPATDINRAVKFYSSVMEINIEIMEFEGMKMGVLPSEGQTIFGTIVQGKGFDPSPNGVTIYINGGDDLQVMLDKVESSGGSILMPKTPHADESGYFAIFLDSEGNKLGLHSVE